MKTPRCPLCGEELAPSVQSYGFEYVCWKCKWQTASLCSTEQGAKKAAQKLISKFPPIMRVWPGDKLQVEDGSICEVINVHKNLAMMDVRRGEGRPVFTIADTHVLRWPWELDQKGGSND